MKQLVFIFTIFSFLGCQKQDSVNQMLIGEKVTTEKAVDISSLPTILEATDSKENVVLSGKVSDVCKAKGCWMKLKMAKGEDVRVTFKDYALFMPKDIVGKEVVIHGVASKKEISVDELQHYAKDAGKSEEEIASINQSQLQLTFEADGVVIN